MKLIQPIKKMFEPEPETSPQRIQRQLSDKEKKSLLVGVTELTQEKEGESPKNSSEKNSTSQSSIHRNDSTIRNEFRVFILNFKTENSKLPKYKTILEELFLSKERILNIDCKDLYNHDKELYKQLVNFPQKIIPLIGICVQEVVHEMFSDFPQQNITIRTFNLVEFQQMRRLGPTNIDNLICIRGMVTRVSEVILDVKSGHFRCSLCQFSKEYIIDRGGIDEPVICESCSSFGTMDLDHNRCCFSEKQLIKIQETPETIPEGEIPQAVNLCVFDSLVHVLKSGDRIDVTGIYRAVSKRMNPKSRSISNIFRNYIDVIHLKKTDSDETEKFTNDKIKIPQERNFEEETRIEQEKLLNIDKMDESFSGQESLMTTNSVQHCNCKNGGCTIESCECFQHGSNCDTSCGCSSRCTSDPLLKFYIYRLSINSLEVFILYFKIKQIPDKTLTKEKFKIENFVCFSDEHLILPNTILKPKGFPTDVKTQMFPICKVILSNKEFDSLRKFHDFFVSLHETSPKYEKVNFSILKKFIVPKFQNGKEKKLKIQTKTYNNPIYEFETWSFQDLSCYLNLDESILLSFENLSTFIERELNDEQLDFKTLKETLLKFDHYVNIEESNDELFLDSLRVAENISSKLENLMIRLDHSNRFYFIGKEKHL
jgi:hypothetical protein